MTPDTPKDAPETPESPAKWLSVSEAAAAAGISPRAIQKRATRGQLEARKVWRRGVEVWEIDGRELSANLGANREPNRHEPDANQMPIHAQNECEPDANLGANRRELSANQPDEMTARLLATLERENGFLRATIEQLQRDGAETRAALREALKLAPKELTSGANSGELGQVGTDTQAAPQSPRTPENRADGQRDGKASKRAPETAEAAGEVSSYGALADLLDAQFSER